MILVPCPHCGPRNVSEFRYVGETTTRPDPDSATPEQWRDYLYLRRNPAGWTIETWYHRAGCRAYLTAERHTVTNQLRASSPGGGASGGGVSGGGVSGGGASGGVAPLGGSAAEMGDGTDAARAGGSPSA